MWVCERFQPDLNRRTGQRWLVQLSQPHISSSRHRARERRSTISAPPVGGGFTPVIPPPGTPGGDPYIIPK